MTPESACAAPGDLYVIDQGTYTGTDNASSHVYAFTPNTPYLTQTTSSIHPIYFPPGPKNTTGTAVGVAFDNEGNLFVSHPGPCSPPSCGTIIKITPDGTQSTFASGLLFPVGLAFDADGNLFVAENTQPVTGNGKILKFSRNLKIKSDSH